MRGTPFRDSSRSSSLSPGQPAGQFVKVPSECLVLHPSPSGTCDGFRHPIGRLSRLAWQVLELQSVALDVQDHRYLTFSRYLWILPVSLEFVRLHTRHSGPLTDELLCVEGRSLLRSSLLALSAIAHSRLSVFFHSFRGPSELPPRESARLFSDPLFLVRTLSRPTKADLAIRRVVTNTSNTSSASTIGFFTFPMSSRRLLQRCLSGPSTVRAVTGSKWMEISSCSGYRYSFTTLAR